LPAAADELGDDRWVEHRASLPDAIAPDRASCDALSGTPRRVYCDMEGEVELELPAVPASVQRVRDAVRALAAGRVSGLGDVDLAVTEAATNVVVHAYRDRAAGDAPGVLRLAVRREDGFLRVSIADDGVGLSPRHDSPGLGFGLGLIARFADELEIEQISPGTRVIMRFKLSR
jgi:anti-sigma regulatory factor (Ser/Thr protein kinase)